VVAAFRDGLQEAGSMEGENVVIEYRLPEGIVTVWPTFVADLVCRPVSGLSAKRCGGVVFGGNIIPEMAIDVVFSCFQLGMVYRTRQSLCERGSSNAGRFD
jgi:hypothetical protein